MHRPASGLLLLLACLAPAAEPAQVRVLRAESFTDEGAAIAVPGSGTLTYTHRLLTRRGWTEERTGQAEVQDGQVRIAALGEGINVVAFAGGGEARWLAIEPPAAIDRAALLAALPRNGARLLAGDAFSILAMGDSVTATGNHAGMLALLLARATGNQRITVTTRAYPGRSADATARNWQGDLAAAGRVDLGLLMYGLNDEACSVPLEALLEHYRFVAEGLAGYGSDCLFMQPTPHIDVPLGSVERTADSPPPWYAFRTIGFAEALRPLAGELRVPLAETFAAVWGEGGDSIEASVRAMWSVYPLSYNRQFSSLIESDGRGDTIHPNALGHLAMARACLAALAPPSPAPSVQFSGVSRWTPTGVHSTLTLTNRGASERSGRFEVYPPSSVAFEVLRPVTYRLAPGASTTVDVAWSQARLPEDLLRFPLDRHLAPGRPAIPLLDVSSGGSRVHAVPAPFAVQASFVRRRTVCAAPVAQVELETAAGGASIAVPFPAAEVGRVPLVRQVGAGWAVAELAFVRYAGAVRGEAVADGELGEWGAQVWSPLGEPCQARFATGPDDQRASPEECRMRWSLRAGAAALHLACDIQGEVAQDRFTVFLDPRPAAELGQVGRYYWLSGSFKPDGVLALSAGETSPRDVRLSGAWRSADGRTRMEITVPYSLCEQSAWPVSGDLGLSLWWVHQGPAGRKTNLQWSEDGHPWNPRWYGVARLQASPDPATLPWMVRVR